MFISDIVSNLDSQCLLYADDLKVFRKISSFSDHLKLQSDLRKIEVMCLQEGLPLNISKCGVMTFSLKHNNSIYMYHVSDSALQRFVTIKDLGIIFDTKLSFSEHYDSIVASALRALGFIIRNSKHFQNNKTLFCCTSHL